MYARIENGQIAEYPLTEGAIKPRFPNTSFTDNFAACLPDGYVRVLPAGRPADDDLKVITEGAPELVNGEWVQTWVQADKYTAQELAALETQKTEQQKQDVRDRRNYLLRMSDWTQLGDAPLTQSLTLEWQTYRQALRDITAQVGFPWTITWPTEP